MHYLTTVLRKAKLKELYIISSQSQSMNYCLNYLKRNGYITGVLIFVLFC